jgi:membrane-bound ClpP family serine protease
MTKEKRIEYLASTFCVFLSAFIIYALVGSMVSPINEDKMQSFFFFGFLGGIGFSALISSIIFAVRFFSKKSTKFKVIASLLWPITFGCVVYVGFLGFIPYQIYNIVKIVKNKSLSTI